jgi:hypothetical protein
MPEEYLPAGRNGTSHEGCKGWHQGTEAPSDSREELISSWWLYVLDFTKVGAMGGDGEVRKMDDPTSQNRDYKILDWTGMPGISGPILRFCNLGFEMSDRPFS